jgi:choline monooxygenase
MPTLPFQIDPDIRRAETIPGYFYSNREWFEKSMESAFLPSWRYFGHLGMLANCTMHPVQLRASSHTEPLIFAQNDERPLLFSNVCTHRANILLDQPSSASVIRCSYHGRTFDNCGKLCKMPEFEGVENFPSERDNLKTYPWDSLGPMCFARLTGETPFNERFAPIKDRLRWFNFDALQHLPDLSTTYRLEAHWMLYTENYLEGFHIPFVHRQLNQAITYEDYPTELYDHGSLQMGIARPGQVHFEVPVGHPDYGRNIYAYYYWIFPNIMLNIYPWGVSLNSVEPVDLTDTVIRFETFVFPDADEEMIRATGLHTTELEDEAIVLRVQRGVNSRAYQRGRFSAKREQGVHHFQRMVCAKLEEKAG